MATLAIAAIATATAVGAYSTIAASKAAEAQAKAQQRIYEYQARLMEKEAEERRKAAELEEQKLAQQQQRVWGTQVALAAKSGLSYTESSDLDVMVDTYGEFMKDRLMTLRNALLDQTTIQQRAQLLRYQGQAALSEAATAKKLSYLSAGSQILGGVASIAGVMEDRQLRNKLDVLIKSSGAGR